MRANHRLSESKVNTPALSIEESAVCAARLRAAVFNAISESDVVEIIRAQVKKAIEGDSAAARTVFALIGAAGRTPAEHAEKPCAIATNALPGTPEKVDIMELRARNGESLHHSGDGRRL